MIFSMTAFARRETSIPAGHLAWELRSVNHRYLEIALRLPEELRALEPRIREQITEQIGRGRVDANLHWKPAEIAGDTFDVDVARVQRLAQALRSIGQTGAATVPPSTLELLRWPGVMRGATLDVEDLGRQTLTLLAQATAELRDTRAREGARLKQFMSERLDAVEQHVRTVRAVLPEVTQAYRERLNARLAEITTTLDPARLEQEIVLFANRTDVAEELERLDAHVQEARRALGGKGQIGRRLDFLMQEFNREANTLGSKSADLRVTNASVELKVLIEQMREQVQNIE
jgi:uncharacterized protein (TIGR00255 family)